MDYEVIYSDRKTLSLSVKDAKLIVRAPRRATRERIEKAISEHLEWIEKHIAKQKLKKQIHPDLTVEKKAELRKLAKKLLPAKTSHFANLMGLKYGRITITGAETRFGSCSSKGNISFSYRLMTYPEEAIDYVVVHELAHLVEMNHSPRFYKIIEQVMPDYKERKKLLKS